MLVLSRKVKEAILLDGIIELKVLEVTAGRVRLGISAPKGRQIQRGELLLRRESVEATTPATT